MFSVSVIGVEYHNGVGVRFRASHNYQPTFYACFDPDFDLVQVYLCGRFLGFAHNFEQAAELVHDLLDNQNVLG